MESGTNINMGSDHFPIFCKIETEISKQQNCIHHKWCFQKANWEKFQNCCNEMNGLHIMDEPIDKINDPLITLILNAARQSIPVIKKRTNVPWWNEEYSDAIRNRKT